MFEFAWERASPEVFYWGFSVYQWRYSKRGAVGIISTAHEDWTPAMDSSIKIEEETPETAVRVKRRSYEDTLDSCQSSQADWIRKYVEQ